MSRSKLEARKLAKVRVLVKKAAELVAIRVHAEKCGYTLPPHAFALLSKQQEIRAVISTPAVIFSPDGRIDKRRQRRYVIGYRRAVNLRINAIKKSA